MGRFSNKDSNVLKPIPSKMIEPYVLIAPPGVVVRTDRAKVHQNW